MPHVSLSIADQNYPCRSLEGVERLGEATDLRIEVVLPEAVERGAWLGQPCSVVLDTGVGGRIIPGVAMSVAAVATSQASAARVYRVRMTSIFAVMALRRRSRIFQHLSIPDIVRKVVEEGGYSSSNIRVESASVHTPRDYVVQYDETDAGFVRRLCEDEGLFFRFEAKDGNEAFVLSDGSTHAPTDISLRHVDAAGLTSATSCLWDCRSHRRRRPGERR